MMSSSINKDYMDIDEFLSSRELCGGLSFPESDYTDEDFGSIADLGEGTDSFDALLDDQLVDDQLEEYTANEIVESFRSTSPLSSDEGKGRSISPDSLSSSRNSPGVQEKTKKENVKTRGKRTKKIDKEKEDNTESHSGKARTSTWQVSKSTDKKCLATSVEIEGVSYTYKLLPTSKSKKQRRQSVPGDLKDGKYWDRRLKNNLAAKRSRDLRRQKEMTVAYKAASLEAENKELQNEVAKLREQVQKLNKKLEEKSNE